MSEATPRVVATDAARNLIATLRAKHGPLMFHQSGGCCGRLAHVLHALGEFMVAAPTCCWATWKAARSRNLIATLRAKHGPLMFHQSGGCCEQLAHVLRAAATWWRGDVLGDLEGCPFYMGEDRLTTGSTQLIIDAVPAAALSRTGQRRGSALPAALAAVLGRGMGERGAGGPAPLDPVNAANGLAYASRPHDSGAITTLEGGWRGRIDDLALLFPMLRSRCGVVLSK